jgi:hemoglobin
MFAITSENDDRTDLRTRVDIERLVRSFYRDVAMDDRLGPIFADARVDWPSHIDRLTDFWCWQLLGEASYSGNPLRAHLPAHRRTPFTAEHFERWLELFSATVDHLYRGPNAEVAKGRAARMAAALSRLLPRESAGLHVSAGRHGERQPPRAAPRHA